MELTSTHRKNLRGLAMQMKPVCSIGKAGLTESVVRELSHHFDRLELIKVKFQGIERPERDALCLEIQEKCLATLCGQVGGTASFFRRNPKAPVIKL
jgi:RNA-binding protein YhbY